MTVVVNAAAVPGGAIAATDYRDPALRLNRLLDSSFSPLHPGVPAGHRAGVGRRGAA